MKLRKEQYAFIIGYLGNKAVIDKRSAKKYKRKTSVDLINDGLFRAALALALIEEKQQEQEMILSTYNEQASTKFSQVADLVRFLGILEVPKNLTGIIEV